jgi:methylmalonyl-CoA/ethylmalonyl-CoA epimerase
MADPIGVRAINHIGIAVRSIADQRTFYESVLGARFDGVEEVPSQKVRVGFFLVGPPGAEVRIELLEPTVPDSPVAAFLDKRGEGVHHLAYSVDGIERVLARLDQDGVRLIDREPRPGSHHTPNPISPPHPRGGGRPDL